MACPRYFFGWITRGGVRVVNEGLVGVGRISGENLDQFGETQGAASGLCISGWAWNGNQISGKFSVLPDRGYNAGKTFSNYAARLHVVNFTFVPYYGTTAASVVASKGDGRLNAGITNDAMFYVYRLTIDASGKKFFRFEVE